MDNVVKNLQTEKEIESFQKHEFNPLIDSFIMRVQNVEKGNEFVLETLNNSFDYIPHKIAMKNKNFPKIVAQKFKQNPSDHQLGILMCKLVADPHL